MPSLCKKLDLRLEMSFGIIRNRKSPGSARAGSRPPILTKTLHTAKEIFAASKLEPNRPDGTFARLVAKFKLFPTVSGFAVERI